MTGIELYIRLWIAMALLLAPGWLLARTLGVRGAAAGVSWSLVLLFGALVVTFVLGTSITLALVLVAVGGLASLAVGLVRPPRLLRPAPGRWWVVGTGTVLGILLWRLAGNVQGDGLFHLARARKLLELDDLSLEAVGEFEDASLHPGYAFPLWHGFLALVARVSGADPEQVVQHLPSVLAPLTILVMYEAGWALFRRAWAAGAVAGGQVALFVFVPGDGGAFTVLSLPATAGDLLLATAALALALEALRERLPAYFVSAAAAGLVVAVVHPTYAIFLWIPFAGFLIVRALWSRPDAKAGVVVLGALVLPAALFMLWLLPVVGETASVSPDGADLQRAFAQYPGQLDIESETSYHLAPEVFSRRGGVAVLMLLLIPFAGLAARRRWAAFVVGGSLAVFAVTLLPFLFTNFADVVSISQARRLAAFLPFAFAFAGGFAVLSRLAGPVLPPVALIAGASLPFLYRGDFGYRFDDPEAAWAVWVAVVGALLALVVGRVLRRAPLEASAGLAAALFLLPVAAVGLVRWAPARTPPATLLSTGFIQAVRAEVPERAVVYSDQETSFRIAAFAPVYVAVAPPGHVADTEQNRPRERAADARRFLRTGDLEIPRSYGAEYLAIDRLRTRRGFDLPEIYRDERFVLYRLP